GTFIDEHHRHRSGEWLRRRQQGIDRVLCGRNGVLEVGEPIAFRQKDSTSAHHRDRDARYLVLLHLAPDEGIHPWLSSGLTLLNIARLAHRLWMLGTICRGIQRVVPMNHSGAPPLPG